MVQNPYKLLYCWDGVPQNHIKSWIFYDICDTLKNGKIYVIQSQRLSIGSWITEFYSCHKTDKKFWETIWFWGTMLQRCMDFEPCFKVYNLVSVYPKTWSDDISQRDRSCGCVSLAIGYNLKTRPSSLLNFGLACSTQCRFAVSHVQKRSWPLFQSASEMTTWSKKRNDKAETTKQSSKR